MRRLGRRARIVSFLLGVLVAPWLFPLLCLAALQALGADVGAVEADSRRTLECPCSQGPEANAARPRFDPARVPR